MRDLISLSSFATCSFLRRSVLMALGFGVTGVLVGSLVQAQTLPTEVEMQSRTMGMLYGSLIGDALGGPVEFKSAEELAQVLPDLRRQNAETCESLLESWSERAFELPSYVELRPDIAPYGPWEVNAAKGTVTDDSRHKMIVMRCLRHAKVPPSELRPDDLARAYLDYFQQPRWSKAYRELARESFVEYHQAARWILGDRNLSQSLPPERIWAGIANCSGQMALLPLAALSPDAPEQGYQQAFLLGFLDTGQAKDINCSIVAGLSAAIGASHERPQDRWQAAIRAMRATDPYRYGDVPFARRPTLEWLDFAVQAADDAKGCAADLYRTLESRGRPKYYWDAHFTFTTAWAFLHFAEYDPEKAMLVSLAFGHDTDSTAQLVGAFCGAIYGPNIFPKETKTAVRERLQADYGESVEEWSETLARLRRTPLENPKP